jgi:hypothetical protein
MYASHGDDEAWNKCSRSVLYGESMPVNTRVAIRKPNRHFSLSCGLACKYCSWASSCEWAATALYTSVSSSTNSLPEDLAKPGMLSTGINRLFLLLVLASLKCQANNQ